MLLTSTWQNDLDGISKLIARAWLESDFKQKLATQPRECLQEVGFALPEGVTVRVDEGAKTWKVEPAPTSQKEALLTIPLPPRPENLTDAELDEWLETSESQPIWILAPTF